MSRAWTKEEMRNLLMNHLLYLPAYWANTPIDLTAKQMIEDAGSEMQYRLEGMLHSILVALDGCAGELPAFNITPAPHPDDQEFHKKENSNYWTETVLNDDVHLKDSWGTMVRNRKARRLAQRKP